MSTPDYRNILIKDLQKRDSLYRKSRAHLIYRGPEHFVIEHGKFYELVLYPAQTVEQGLPLKCFANSITHSIVYGLRYVEGYYLTPFGETIHHAWNIDKEGRLVDSTCLNTGLAYLGVEFSVERADDCSWEGDASVLDDFNRGWPLLQKRWTGEDNSTPESWRLQLLRAGKIKELFDQMEAEVAQTKERNQGAAKRAVN